MKGEILNWNISKVKGNPDLNIYREICKKGTSQLCPVPEKFSTGLNFAVLSHLHQREAIHCFDGAMHTITQNLNFVQKLLVYSCVQFKVCPRRHGWLQAAS